MVAGISRFALAFQRRHGFAAYFRRVRTACRESTARRRGQRIGQFGDPYRFSAYDESGRVGIDFGVYGAPETFLIDGEGNIVFKYIGPLGEEVWAEEFEPRLKQIETGS